MKFSHGVTAFVVLFGASVLGTGYLVTRTRDRQQSAESYAHQGSAARAKPLWTAPDFDLADHRGGRLTKQSLLGRPWVVNFIFTSCQSVCPLLTAKMVQLQRKLPQARLHFVSISVDPEHDDPMTLGAYAQGWAPSEERWSLLASTPEALGAVLKGFKVTAEKADSGPDPIVHTGIFVLVDAHGQVRGVYDSEHREEFLALAGDAARLAAAPVAAPAQGRSGAQLYADLSCGNCHDRPALAPALGGLLGRKVELDNGLLIDADEGYLLESILIPEAKRVRGYPLRMPTYDGVIESADLITLLSHLKQLPPTASAPAPATATDPICQMEVSVTEQTPSAPAPDGGAVYFCSPTCQKTYLARPH